VPQAFSTEDLYLHRKITALHGVDASDFVVGQVRRVDRGEDAYCTDVWQFGVDGSAARQLTFAGSDTAPRLAPAGDRVAFVSSRDGGKPQLLCMSLRAGGEAQPVSRLEQGVESFRWLADGSGWLVTSAVPVPDNRDGPWAALNAAETIRCDVEVAWRLPYKEDGLDDLLRRQIHLFALDGATGKHRPITEGAYDVHGFDVSADGRRVAYVRSREGRYAHSFDLWMADIDGGAKRKLTNNHAMVMQPAWSPDGRHIAFTGAQAEGDAEPRLWLVDIASGECRELCPGEIDVADPESVAWSADGAALFFARAHRGRHQIVRLDLASSELQVLAAGDRQLGPLARARGHFAYTVEHPSLPSDAWACGLDGRAEVRLSRLNPWWDDRTPIRAESREFRVPDGQGSSEQIQGWLLRAQGTDGPTPLLNDVHGGPASYALLDFDTNVFWQVLCSRGWSVLALNAVGSSSFGREFCQRLAGHWGKYDLPQHLAAIDALQAEGVCDQRLAISGKSYGGYLSSWSIGHTERYRAAVVMAPVGNIETHYGTSDGGYYADPYYLDSKPVFPRRLARDLSPLQYVERSVTPTLFMQGKDDERCPRCQSEELFVSLYRAGDTPTQLVLYPGETHSFLGEGTPSVRQDAAERITAWIEYYVRTGDGQ
jgi:dipeptidyl aminopeptidase/acylaminoacyl peptidase